VAYDVVAIRHDSDSRHVPVAITVHLVQIRKRVISTIYSLSPYSIVGPTPQCLIISAGGIAGNGDEIKMEVRNASGSESSSERTLGLGLGRLVILVRRGQHRDIRDWARLDWARLGGRYGPTDSIVVELPLSSKILFAALPLFTRCTRQACHLCRIQLARCWLPPCSVPRACFPESLVE
jgi:hypothetical protein